MPQVSVILPFYNAGPFLKKAIHSVLAQTFTDFELLIFNDGSTDASEEIVRSFSDPRIQYFHNEKNRGLIYNLNRGIDIASGNYITIMHGDDICQPERLAEQRAWLDKNTETAIVASFSDEIDATDKVVGFYALDRETTSASRIRKTMPRENCVTHPTVMGRAEIFKTYKYAANQFYVEDYDMWMRLLADGKIIEKVPKPLLLYRVHNTSITQTKLRKNVFLRTFNCKRRYLASRLAKGRFNYFDLRVCFRMILDLAKAVLKIIKRTLIKK